MSVSPGNGWLPARPEIERGGLSWGGKLAPTDRKRASTASRATANESILVTGSPDLVILFSVFLNTW